jgi:hypothetical protein
VEWRLPEVYYEACIYQGPGTRQALQCYYSLESRLSDETQQTSNSLVTFEKEKLRKLKVLASRKSSNSGANSSGVGEEEF